MYVSLECIQGSQSHVSFFSVQWSLLSLFVSLLRGYTSCPLSVVTVYHFKDKVPCSTAASCLFRWKETCCGLGNVLFRELAALFVGHVRFSSCQLITRSSHPHHQQNFHDLCLHLYRVSETRDHLPLPLHVPSFLFLTLRVRSRK